MLHLDWHQYKYYPYERELALREVQSLLAPAASTESAAGVIVAAPATPLNADRLVYFSSQRQADSVEPQPTRQALLERVGGNGTGRQATRYSAHGLHEYKGKFNPQIAKALLNIFGAMPGDWALDPFCGSGTSLLEAAHLGINAVGSDINPMAVYLANAKLKSLSIAAAELEQAANTTMERMQNVRPAQRTEDARSSYLAAWFPEDVLNDIENLRCAISHGPDTAQEILLVIASNLLREYSLQEPSDLRIRRRSSPMPTVSYLDAFRSAVTAFCRKMAESQRVLGIRAVNAEAFLGDSRESLAQARRRATANFDVALTSPPYATALPYIDTQRLSLVWLGLLDPANILTLESQLVGSREIRGQSKSDLLDSLTANAGGLPETEARLCIELQAALTEADGFRRQAVPRLLYRYFVGMAESFQSVREVMKPGAMYGLIVGGNHTVLSGKRFDINTPAHLANLASSKGWTHVETVELQTYKRYGLHSKNASLTEALVILRA